VTSTESPFTARSRGRIDGVDLLRGLAIFFVLMNHVNMRLLIADVPYTKGLSEQLVSSLVWNGQSGVQIFFAVSGDYTHNPISGEMARQQLPAPPPQPACYRSAFTPR
jgi:peptidoglycan/LPS O-acetylase OafA/YrhL